MQISINPDKFTLGDMEDFEEITGKSFDEALKPVPVYDEDGKRKVDEKGRPISEAKMTAKVLTTLVWLVARADNEGFTLADARKTRVTELIFESDEDSDSEGND